MIRLFRILVNTGPPLLWDWEPARQKSSKAGLAAALMLGIKDSRDSTDSTDMEHGQKPGFLVLDVPAVLEVLVGLSAGPCLGSFAAE